MLGERLAVPPPGVLRHFEEWVARSRWWPEWAVVRVSDGGKVEAVVAPPLAASATPPGGVKFPTLLVVRYLSAPVGRLLAGGDAELPLGPDGERVPLDTTPEKIKAATVAVVELLVDVERGAQGDVVVCRQLTVRPGNARGRWTCVPPGSSVPLLLINPETAEHLPYADGGRISGIGHLPLEELLSRYLTYWARVRWLTPGRRRRKFTLAVIDRAAQIARDNPNRPVRALAECLDQLGVKASKKEENRRQVAQRLIDAAIAEGKLAADAPGLRRTRAPRAPAHNRQSQPEGKE
ncbi:MAG: hypothetical protein M0027_06585 [Candidatus Dormibacteraeota bacterium]|nr:hypothetical protein [Candidatus Dormibacteraeota bacterium]